MSSKKSKQVKCKSHFQDLWLTDSEFSGWLKIRVTQMYFVKYV